MLSFELWRVRRRPTWTRFLGRPARTGLFFCGGGGPLGKSKVLGEGPPAFLGQLGPEKNLGAIYLTFSLSLFLPDTISQEQSWFPK